MARAAEVPLTIDEFQAIAERTPYLADLRPSGKYMMEDLNRVGGVPAVLKYASYFYPTQYSVDT
jgi:dihydroxy-acid dehydratase